MVPILIILVILLFVLIVGYCVVYNYKMMNKKTETQPIPGGNGNNQESVEQYNTNRNCYANPAPSCGNIWSNPKPDMGDVDQSCYPQVI